MSDFQNAMGRRDVIKAAGAGLAGSILSDAASAQTPADFWTAEYTAKTIPGAKLSVYEGIGHAPFYEDATRFNTELAAFVRGANKTN